MISNQLKKFQNKHFLNTEKSSFLQKKDNKTEDQQFDQFRKYLINENRKYLSNYDQKIIEIIRLQEKMNKLNSFLLFIFIELLGHYNQIIIKKEENIDVRVSKGFLYNLLDDSKNAIKELTQKTFNQVKNKVYLFFMTSPNDQAMEDFASEFITNETYENQRNFNDLRIFENTPNVVLLENYLFKELRQDLTNSIDILIKSNVEHLQIKIFQALIIGKNIKLIKSFSAQNVELFCKNWSQFELHKINCDYLLSLLKSPEDYYLKQKFLFTLYTVRISVNINEKEKHRY